MDLSQYRAQIDDIDDALLKLFCQRMQVSALIAEYKNANSLPIFVPSREQEKLADIAQKAGPEMAPYAQALYSCLFHLSKEYQQACIISDNIEAETEP